MSDFPEKYLKAINALMEAFEALNAIGMSVNHCRPMEELKDAVLEHGWITFKTIQDQKQP